MSGLKDRLSACRARLHTRPDTQANTAEQHVGIGDEVPIRTESEDRLTRADFADRVVNVLSELSLREGRVFAIRGGWGFGKSSLKNLIAERLDAMEGGADWLDFNPWQWGDGDAIVRALFGQMADKLGGEHSSESIERAEVLRRYGAILTGASAGLKEAADSSKLISTLLTNGALIAIVSAVGLGLPSAASVTAGLALLASCSPWLGGLLSHLGQDRSKDPLDKVRQALEVRLRKLERPLVVFVDDIDRLEPEQIRTVLRQVKANANLPNIVFVLLFQPDIVESALDEVANGNGRAFLEKIVQANFDLPAVPISLVHSVFWEELSRLIEPFATEANGFTQTHAGNAIVGCIQPMVRNLRDARRLNSSIAVHLPLHANGEVFEVNIVDFLVLEALRVFEPNLHESLFREKDLILQGRRSTSDGQRDDDRDTIERLRDLASKRRSKVALDALKFLFPTIEWAFGGSEYADGNGWLKAKRVCTSRFFPRYFELQTPVGEISEHRFSIFLRAIATEDELAAEIDALEISGLLPSLAARLDESVERLPVERARVLLPGMFMIAKKLASSSGTGLLNMPWTSAWRATNFFLRRIHEEQRGELALDALRKTKALSVAAMLIYLSDPNDRSEGRGELTDPALDQASIEAMKEEWVRLIRELASDNGMLGDEPDLPSLLYRWRDYTGSLEEPRNWVTTAIRTNEGFASITAKMMSQVRSFSSGDRVAASHNKFNSQTIDDFIGIREAKIRCERIDPSDFPAHEDALRTLHRSVDMWLDSSEPSR